MKSLICFFAATLLTYQCRASIDCQVPTTEILESVVRVVSGDSGKASGVVIAQDVVLTAAHVIDGANAVYMESGGNLIPAKIGSIDFVKDIAILFVPTEDLKPVPFSMNELHDQQQVWAVGYPLGGNLVVSLGQFKDRIKGKIHTSAAIDSGHSGGGLISCEDDRHVLAGMLRAYAAYQEGNQYIRIKNLSISVSSKLIEDFMLN